MFGGISCEHEVSVITGLHTLENIDRDLYDVHAIYHTKKGELLYLGDLKNKRDFLKVRRKDVVFGKDKKGGFFETRGFMSRRIYPDCAYLTFHGGTGESGQIQGFLEILEVPYTSPNVESSAIAMNKMLTKQVLKDSGVPFLEGLAVFSDEIEKDVKKVVKKVLSTFSLPVILKPVHLGSSIGINIAKSEIELEKYLLESAQIDSEILIEKFLEGFKEYNISVRLINGELEVSEIERPLPKDEILSFADKYIRGGGKKGGKGMASLNRELPAKIDKPLKEKIEDYAKKIFVSCRCKGMVRIDFMVTAKGQIYLTEINPIPGSMAYYLWEASGIPFKKQITEAIEQAINDFKKAKAKRLDYKTDIVEKYINQT